MKKKRVMDISMTRMLMVGAEGLEPPAFAV